MTPGSSAALARRVAGALVTDGMTERPITVDQTNHSVVVGESVVVKWLRTPSPPPHRGARLLAHLTEVGFAEMPPYLGAPEVDGNVVAVVTGYVAGATDGWEWYVDELTAGFERGDTTVATDTAARIGALAARLHRALARPSTIVPEPCRRATTAAEHRRGTRLLDEALRVTPGAAGERLAARVARLGDDIETLDTAGAIGTQPIHGDLHVGQLLRDGAGRIAVTDFDGDPVSPVGELGSDGVERRSAMVDLASLVQSVDHVARVVARWRPDLGDQVPTFVAAATTRVVEAYAEVAPIEPQLLKPLRAIQELHELVYAAHVLPRWRYAPDAALATLYP